MSNKNILTKNKHNLLLITHLKHLIHNCLHLVYGGKQKVKKKKKNKYNSRKDKMKKARVLMYKYPWIWYQTLDVISPILKMEK